MRGFASLLLVLLALGLPFAVYAQPLVEERLGAWPDDAALTLRLPAGLRAVEEEAFASVAASRVFLPEGVSSLGARAFAGSALRYLYLPDSLCEIDERALEGCEGLTVYCSPGSFASRWCASHGVHFRAPDAVDSQPEVGALYCEISGALYSSDGEAIPLSSLCAQPVVLVFFSSWHDDCASVLGGSLRDALLAAQAEGASCFLVLREGVGGDTAALGVEALARAGLDVPLLIDKDQSVFCALGLRSVPSLAILGEGGRLSLLSGALPDAEGIRAMLAYVRGGALMQTESLALRLLLPGGLAASSYRMEGGELLADGSALSETLGLLLLYAVQAGDRALFDRLMEGAALLSVNGLTAWQMQNGELSAVNATIDDFRIIDALLLADERWGGYAAEASQRGGALLRGVVAESLPRDFTDLSTPGWRSERVSLSTLDVAAMRRMARKSAAWASVAQRSAEVLASGVVSDAFPLFYPAYDAQSGLYVGEELHTAEALVTVLHAAQAGLCPARTLDWLEARLRREGLFARYDLAGNVLPGYRYESTAVYALLVQIGHAAGRPELMRLAQGRMESGRSFDSAMLGGYGDASAETHYSFDVLEALLALQAIERGASER